MMNSLQKESWFVLILISTTVTIYLILLPLWGPKAAQSCFCLLGLLGLIPSFHRWQKGTITLDERDTAIIKKATLTGYTVFWLYYVASTMVIINPMAADSDVVAKHFVSTAIIFGLIVLMGVRAVAMLVLYRAQSPRSGRLLESLRNIGWL